MNIILSIAVIFIGCSCPALGQGNSDRITISASGAVFEGRRETLDRDRRQFYSFQGIQYAKPPVGDLRWAEPELAPVASKIDATSYKEKCPQFESSLNLTIGNEDCLYLNIYTPYVPPQTLRPGPAASRSLPVMVYIHGGAYEHGSGDRMGPRRLMKQDVVLVTLNYRLGVFGFLSTGDEVMPGNYGLLDQIAALRWVKLHIKGFGGNPDSVTIFGNSAGGASVNILMLSPHATSLRLFNKAIMQSGTAMCDWAIEKNPLEYATQVAEAVGCSGSSEEMKTCLMDIPASDLIQAQNSLHTFMSFPLRHAPVIDSQSRPDNPVLPDDPKILMAAGGFAQMPVMLGVTSDEGLEIATALVLRHGVENFKNEEYFHNTILPEIVALKNYESDVIIKAVKEHYNLDNVDFNETSGPRIAFSELTELVGDAFFYSCQHDTLEKLAADGRIEAYSYVFTHKTQHSPSNIAKNIEKLKISGMHHPLFSQGVTHADELYFLFDPFRSPTGSFNKPLTAMDERVSDIMTRVWAGFATNGNPAAAIQGVNLPKWQPVSQENINYFNLTGVSAPMGTNFRKGEAMFWDRTVPYLEELGDEIDSLSLYPILFYVFLALFVIFLIITIALAIALHKKRKFRDQYTVNS